MKKSVLAVCLLAAASLAQAETIKMKTGELISGSILSQTEYTLNLATSYGNITLNQREIEQILPDKHRIILKGGTQLVGVILDLDEFNLKLQTDDGATVNVDMPQIVAIEVYDYDQGKKAQQEFVQQNIQEQQAAQAAAQAAAQSGQAAVVEAAGGLTFDSDINQVFGAQKATVVNGTVVTPSAAPVEVPAARPLSDEEAFVKGVKTGEVSQQDYAAAAKQELASKKPAKKETPAKKSYQEKNFNKYFAIQAGAMPLDLNISGTINLGDLYSVNLGDETVDVGGTSAVISSKFLWRIKESNFWAGPVLSFASISNNSFSGTNGANTLDASSSGNILSIGADVHYYLNPASRFTFYLTGSAAYEMLTLNYRGTVTNNAGSTPQETPFRDTISSNTIAGSVGLGVETWVDDLMLGVEVRQVFAAREDELKESAASNTVVQAQLSWKF